MRVACLQMRSGVSIDANLQTLSELVAQAAGEGARYVQSPEMTSILERNPKRLFSQIGPDRDNPTFTVAARLAREHGIWLHLGSVAVDLENGRAANRAALFSPAGERVASYDKMHMFDVDLDGGESWRESAVYQPGARSVTVDAGEFRLGLSICYDLRFPHLYRHQAKAGVQILTCPAAFTRQTGEAHWHALLRARAIENGAFVIAAAQGGEHEDGRTTYGHSLIVNPWGEIIAELGHDEPGVLTADLDLSQVERARSKIPSLKSDTGFAVENIEVETARAGSKTA